MTKASIDPLTALKLIFGPDKAADVLRTGKAVPGMGEKGMLSDLIGDHYDPARGQVIVTVVGTGTAENFQKQMTATLEAGIKKARSVGQKTLPVNVLGLIRLEDETSSGYEPPSPIQIWKAWAAGDIFQRFDEHEEQIFAGVTGIGHLWDIDGDGTKIVIMDMRDEGIWLEFHWKGEPKFIAPAIKYSAFLFGEWKWSEWKQ